MASSNQIQVRKHLRETRQGVVSVKKHTRVRDRERYQPTGRFGAYLLNGYENEYAVYPHYNEDPLYDGFCMGQVATEYFDEAITWVKMFNDGTEPEVADWTEAERNWSGTGSPHPVWSWLTRYANEQRATQTSVTGDEEQALRGQT
jgi:hypothetical protein